MRKNLLIIFLFFILNQGHSTIDAGWQPAAVISVQQTSDTRASSLLKKLKEAGQELTAKVNAQGVSHNLLIADPKGNLIGVFRNRSITGEAEYRVFLLDSDGFFHFPAVIEMVLQVNGVPCQGYLQEFIPLPNEGETTHPASLCHQIQRLGILDIMLANADRHDGNILIQHGQLIPIDHNLTLVGTLDGFQLVPFVTQGPEAQQIIPVPRVLPIWLSDRRFSKLAEAPFDGETLQYIQRLDTDQICKTLKATGLTDSRLRLINTLIQWMKQGSAAGLTLQQLGQPVFASYAFESSAKLARREGVDGLHRISRLEYDLHRAAMLMQEQQIPWDRAVDQVFTERIATIKGTTTESPQEMLLNLIDWSSYPRLSKIHPENRLIVKTLARNFTQRKSANDGGLDWRTTSQIYRDYLYLLADTYASMQLGKENWPIGQRFIEFLSMMTDQSQTLMLKGQIWNEELLKLMFTTPLEKVKQSIEAAKQRSQAEAAFYKESLGQEWESFATPKFIDQSLREKSKS